MSRHEVVRRHVDAFNARDEAAEPWSEDAEIIAPGASASGREAVLAFLRVFHEGFPDGRLELISVLGSGSRVAAEGRFVGTHTGTLRGAGGSLAPTGREVSFRWAAVYEVDGSRLRSEHLYFDQVELLSQLGALAD